MAGAQSTDAENSKPLLKVTGVGGREAKVTSTDIGVGAGQNRQPDTDRRPPVGEQSTVGQPVGSGGI